MTCRGPMVVALKQTKVQPNVDLTAGLSRCEKKTQKIKTMLGSMYRIYLTLEFSKAVLYFIHYLLWIFIPFGEYVLIRSWYDFL